MEGLRIDRLLWFLRYAPTRSHAQKWVQAGHFRLNGKRVEKPGHLVVTGDVLALPMRQGVQVIRIRTLPQRRGPPAEALACYERLDDTAASP